MRRARVLSRTSQVTAPKRTATAAQVIHKSSKRLLERQVGTEVRATPNGGMLALPAVDIDKAALLEKLDISKYWNPAHMEKAQKFAPGMAASGAVMVGGYAVAEQLGQALLSLQGVTGQSPISAIPVAIVIGCLARNKLLPMLDKVAPSYANGNLAAKLEPGAKYASASVLRAGIICIGAKLSVLDLATVGLTGVPAVAAAIGAGMLVIPKIAGQLQLPEKMGKLISIGTSVCGVTAISATAPVIKAEQKEVAFAIANVVAFGTLGMLTYPYLAHSVFTHSEQVGLFLGLAVHDTSQVMGSALTYHNVYTDETALKVAAVTKLTRNLSLAAIVPLLAMGTSGQSAKDLSLKDVKKLVPGFVLGFIGMSAVRSMGDYTLGASGSAFGLLDKSQWLELTSLLGNQAAPVLLGVAMAGLGLSTSTSALNGVGPRPFVAGLLGALTVGGTGLVAALLLPHFVQLSPPIAEKTAAKDEAGASELAKSQVASSMASSDSATIPMAASVPMAPGIDTGIASLSSASSVPIPGTVNLDTRATVAMSASQASLLSTITANIEEPRYADAVIRVGKEKYPVHRMVMSSVPFFDAEFARFEKTRDEQPILYHLNRVWNGRSIKLQEMEPEVFRKVLQVIYSGDLAPILALQDPTTVEAVIQAARRFEMASLEKTALQHLLQLTASGSFLAHSPDSVGSWIQTARRNNVFELERVCFSFIRKHPEEILMADQVLALHESDPELYKEIVQTALHP